MALEKVLTTIWITRGGSKVLQGLIKWVNLSAEDSTRPLLKLNFHPFHILGDKNVLMKGVLLYIGERYIRIERIKSWRKKWLFC